MGEQERGANDQLLRELARERSGWEVERTRYQVDLQLQREELAVKLEGQRRHLQIEWEKNEKDRQRQERDDMQLSRNDGSGGIAIKSASKVQGSSCIPLRWLLPW